MVSSTVSTTTVENGGSPREAMEEGGIGGAEHASNKARHQWIEAAHHSSRHPFQSASQWRRRGREALPNEWGQSFDLGRGLVSSTQCVSTRSTPGIEMSQQGDAAPCTVVFYHPRGFSKCGEQTHTAPEMIAELFLATSARYA